MARPKDNKEQKDTVQVVKFSNHTIPEFREVTGKDWVYYGEKNNYPDYLLKLYSRSAKHNAIVNGKACYITGKGWEADEQGASVLTRAEALQFIQNAGIGQTLNQITYKAVLDLEIFGGFALEIVWDKKGKKIASIAHVDFGNVRTNEDGSEYYYTSKWFKRYSRKDDTDYVSPIPDPDNNKDWKVYQPYDPENRKGSQLLYFKQYRPGMDVYPLPEYLGCVPWIETDFEIANFHYNNVKNGFTASHLLKFYNGIPTEDQQTKIEEKIKAKFSGSDNAGRFVTVYSKDKEHGSEVETLTMSDIDKQFEVLNKTIQQEIFSGHNVTSPMLFGIKTEGQLGGRTEIIEANELFQNTYVNKKQQLVELVFNELAKANGIVKIKLTHLEPIGLDWMNSVVQGILTDDEKREKAGLKPIKKDENASVKVSDSINTLSPLVANEVLKSMTTNEIRSLASLPPIIGGDTIPAESAAPEKFSAQGLVKIFSEYGRQKDTAKILNKWNIEGDRIKVANLHEETFTTAKEYFVSTTALDRSILDLLSKDPLIPSDQLAEALNIPVKKIDVALAKLEEDGLIKVTKETIKQDEFKNIVQVTRTPSDKALQIVEARPPKTYTIEVLYSYEWNPVLNTDEDEDKSREFCKELMSLNQLYTREEIETISERVGYDVWVHKGGWYTKPGTDIHLPYCRHTWVQNLVTKEENG